MRIAQIAPPWIAVPPAGYGGTEWVVKHLCDGLVARGHEVHLYATGDSDTAAELHALFPAQMPGEIGRTPYDARHASWALDEIARDGAFDVVHDHSGFLGIAFGGDLRRRMVHTVHCAFDPAAYGFYEQFRDAVGYVSISDFQRTLGPARHALGGDRVQRPARRRLALPRAQGRLPARLRPRLRGQGLPPRHRGRAAHGQPARSWRASCRSGTATTSSAASRLRSTTSRSSTSAR